jgi:outer membrane translocation and assembly module TamA
VCLRSAFDTRDNTNAPHTGALLRYEWALFDSALGSDYDFSEQTLDARYYHPTSERTTLAVAALVRSARGDVPFRRLSTPDGEMILRGIEKRRYIDKALTAFQVEYRYPIRGAWSGTAFVEAAQVAPSLEGMRGDAYKTSVGLGLRFALAPEERLNVRADVSFVDDEVGFVLFFREAF